MAATNHTPVIDLTQYVNTDKPAYLTDHNSDMLKIDTAIGADRARLNTLESNQTGSGGLTDRITKAESDIDSLETNVTSIGGRTGVLETEYSALEGRVDTLEDTTDDQARAIQGTTQLAYTIGNPYDSTVTYSVGDYAIVNNTLYKCITAVTTGEAFDASKWQSVKVMSEIGHGGASTAAAVTYDNTASGLTATNVQSAIDEISSESGAAWEDITNQFDMANANVTLQGAMTAMSIDTTASKVYRKGRILFASVKANATATAQQYGNGIIEIAIPTSIGTCIPFVHDTTFFMTQSGEVMQKEQGNITATNIRVELTVTTNHTANDIVFYVRGLGFIQ